VSACTFFAERNKPVMITNATKIFFIVDVNESERYRKEIVK
jgi:hypothetical protein